MIENTAANWINDLTENMAQKKEVGRKDITKDSSLYKPKSDRIYCEQLHLHPIRVSVTFSQQWNVLDTDSASPAILEYIKMVPSLTNAQLIFTSFVVGHVFEAPETLRRVIAAHFLSQMKNHNLFVE